MIDEVFARDLITGENVSIKSTVQIRHIPSGNASKMVKMKNITPDKAFVNTDRLRRHIIHEENEEIMAVVTPESL
jgi:hypothetical protein